MTVGLGRNPFNVRCSHCKTDILHTYNEVTLYWDNLLCGNPDLLVLKGNKPKLSVIEIKSIKPTEGESDKEGFKKLTGPHFDYKFQGYSYVRLLEKNIEKFRSEGIEVNLDDYDFIFSSKGYSFKDSVIKQFNIPVKGLSPITYKDTFDENIKVLENLYNNLTIPKREICSSLSCREAKACPVSTECFSYGDNYNG